ncbi:hypothetical protein [Streptomyces sp. NPDC017086]|uniref:hypothetical protein n=1 Tax=Streptomyces sp. NPDC017086 TaxID=3364976 RepID=UPI00378C9752
MNGNVPDVEALLMASDTARASSALAALPLPEFDTLTKEQARGAACVWDGAPLTADTAVDLGERRSIGGCASWFPRACKPCALQHAMDTLIEHTQICEQCTDDQTVCPDGLWMVRAVREARR